MIALASGLRVYLACGVTDKRNYVAHRIMRSPGRLEWSSCSYIK